MDDDGQVMAPLRRGVAELSAFERTALERLPYEEGEFRSQAGLVQGARADRPQDVPLYARIWREPAVAVIAFESRAIVGSSNQIIDSARARVSVRTVPNQDSKVVQDALVQHFETRVPFGLEVHIEREEVASSWLTSAEGAGLRRRAPPPWPRATGATARSSGAAGPSPSWGRSRACWAACPALLTGVEDPLCHAHSENESLLIEDWKKGTRAAVHLYAELAGALTPR
jgi:acetylornithine deacetylase/succinyl-diaminopimelate desuccinylase-like protein